MSITITTKYQPPSSSRGARIKATPCHGKSVSIAFPYQFDGRRAHDAAVRHLMDKWEMPHATFHVGETESGYVYIIDADKLHFAAK